jgi:uncharacterized cupin superfamily protein
MIPPRLGAIIRPSEKGKKVNIDSIKVIEADESRKFVPPLSDYSVLSRSWEEAEFHCVDLKSDNVRVGYWVGEPGSILLSPWTYTEVCSILRGRVAIDDRQGGRREFTAGQGFVVPKGFSGEWITIEPSAKIFVAIY